MLVYRRPLLKDAGQASAIRTKATRQLRVYHCVEVANHQENLFLDNQYQCRKCDAHGTTQSICIWVSRRAEAVVSKRNHGQRQQLRLSSSCDEKENADPDLQVAARQQRRHGCQRQLQQS